MHATLTISGQTLTRLAPHGLGPVSRKSQNGTIIQRIHNLHADRLELRQQHNVILVCVPSLILKNGSSLWLVEASQCCTSTVTAGQ